MIVQHSGQLMARIQRAHFNALAASAFNFAPLPGIRLHPLFQSSHYAGLAFAQSTSTAPDWVVATPR